MGYASCMLSTLVGKDRGIVLCMLRSTTASMHTADPLFPLLQSSR